MRCCVGLFKNIKPCRALKAVEYSNNGAASDDASAPLAVNEEMAAKYKFLPNIPLSVVALHDDEFQAMMKAPPTPLRTVYPQQRNRFFVRPASQSSMSSSQQSTNSKQHNDIDDTAVN